MDQETGPLSRHILTYRETGTRAIWNTGCSKLRNLIFVQYLSHIGACNNMGRWSKVYPPAQFLQCKSLKSVSAYYRRFSNVLFHSTIASHNIYNGLLVVLTESGFSGHTCMRTTKTKPTRACAQSNTVCLQNNWILRIIYRYNGVASALIRLLGYAG